MMRHHRFYTQMLSALLLALIPTLVFADRTEDFVRDFNAKNVNRGLMYASSAAYYKSGTNYNGQSVAIGESKVTMKGTFTPDLSAYSANTSGSNFFHSFCISPGVVNGSGDHYGTLNYVGQRTTTTQGLSLTVGVAYLYKEFAAGTLGANTTYAYNYTTTAQRNQDALDLQYAIWYLMGVTQIPQSPDFNANLANNKFLQLLNSMTGYSQDFWRNTYYDPASNYGGLMGGVQVFAMNSSSGAQDILFATTGAGNGVPEPASLLLWTLGSLGAAGMTYRKRRKA